MNKEQEIKNQIIHKEIDLIQSIINRMAKNSFLIKGWLISLIAVILALKPNEVNIKFLIFMLGIITFAFWFLDAFYLKTERIYRIIYEFVIEQRENEDFNRLYNLNPRKFPNDIKKKYPGIFKVMFSTTLVPFYLIPIILLVVGYFIY